MPRSTVDQALVTGLSITTNQAIVTLLQESIQAGAFVLTRRMRHRPVDTRTWSRSTIALDGAVFGAGLLIQRALRQQPRERLPRAGARTGGFWLSATGAAGVIVGTLEELLGDRAGRNRAALAVALPATGALAAANELARRRRARLDVGASPEDTSISAGRSLLFGFGVAAASSGLAAGERAAADAVARAAARVLPGEVQVWRPVGHAVALGALAATGRMLTQQVFTRIENREEAVETSFDIAPPLSLVSGHHDSLVPFHTLAMQGRRFVWMVTGRDMIEHVTGEVAAAQPIRVYVGLQSAETEAARVELALRELDRTDAFDREWLMVVSPTGTGYVNYAAVSALEFLSNGNCATVAMQYSARPSPLSLGRVSEGRLHMQLLLEGIRARLDARTGSRPKVVLFGESLGAWTSQDPFVDQGTRGFMDKGIDHAIWIGTPHFSKWKEQVLHDDGSDIDAGTVGVFNSIADWNALDRAAREKIRYVMITHYDDGVAVFGPELTVQAPPWLGQASTRPETVPKGMRWMPTTTFFQVLVDMKNAANVVPGVFAARGHDYRADLLPFFDATLGFNRKPDQLAAIATWLETRELERSTWIKHHGTAEGSLSAAIVELLLQRERDAGRDPDATLLQLVRDIASEEFAQGERPSTLSQFGSGDADAAHPRG